jgi:cytochrome c peroxidase
MSAATAAACTDQPTAPPTVASARRDRQPGLDPAEIRLVRQLAAQHGIGPLPAAPQVSEPLARLGQALMFDRVLSGNRDMACSTCHLPAFATSDGRSLPIGADGIGFGPSRTLGKGSVIPRNSPSVLSISSLRHMFWDGRVEVDPSGRFHTPAGAQLTPAMARTLQFGALSAQPMFPPTSTAEMRGHAAPGNELARIPDDSLDAIWAAIMKRLMAIPQYRAMFRAAYPGTPLTQMTFANASNAIAGFIATRFHFANSPWDRFLAGDDRALTPQQLDGAETFLTIKCVQCHNGPTLSDDEFHNVAIAQIGPGEGNGPSLHDDFGRMNVTGDPADRYRFRTTSLRAFIEHYSQSDQKLLDYDPSQLPAELQGTVLDNKAAILANRDTVIVGVVLSPAVVDKLMAYMQALTDPAARNLSSAIPRRVPSGLPVDP